MTKHSLSPQPELLPPYKRTRYSTEQTVIHSQQGTDSTNYFTLYDELVLHIFSYLAFDDLCASNLVCQNWRRLSLENSLWKHLYLYGREIRPLPERVDAEDIQDWKHMFRISYNWQVTFILSSIVLTTTSRKKGRCSLDEIPDDSPMAETHSVHLLLTGSLLISTSSSSLEPLLRLRGTGFDYIIPCPSTQLGVPCYITTLAQDQSPPERDDLCFVAFLSTGEFVEYILHNNDPTTVRRRLVYVPRTHGDRTTPIIQAAYHHPLLVTLSQSFHLSIYNLSLGNVEHTQTLTSFTSYPPSSLVLSAPSPGRYKLVMAYAIPVYPEHFSVGSTELIISPSTTVSSTRSARAVDIPQGWIDETKYKAMREQWDRKVARVAACQTDGRWVVLAAHDPKAHRRSSLFTSSFSSSVLQLYRLSSPSSWAGKPKLTFVRTLHGQPEPISAMTLADGRCVSLGLSGSIWVWDLETGEGAEVARPEGSSPPSSRFGAIAFDESRIVSVHQTGCLSVRRFDV